MGVPGDQCTAFDLIEVFRLAGCTTEPIGIPLRLKWHFAFRRRFVEVWYAIYGTGDETKAARIGP